MKAIPVLGFFYAGVAVLAGRPIMSALSTASSSSRPSSAMGIPAPLDVKRITYSCGRLRPLTFWYYSCSSQDARLPYKDACGLRQRFPNIRHSFPPAFTRMIRQSMNLTHVEISRLMEKSVYQSDPHTTYQRVKWFEKRSDEGNHTVCWPDYPDFTHRDFEEFGGFLAALLVRPETIKLPVPKRFMDLPPGYLAKHRIHFIYHASYSYHKVMGLRTEFRRVPIFGHDDMFYPPLDEVRDHFDTWGGRVGRLLLASMRRSSEYGCSYHLGCISGRQRATYGQPFLPVDYSYAIDHWLRSLVSNEPFAVTFCDIPERIAPTTLWLSAA
ncbi:hypothetical protein CP533_3961 [Ophiocordyceps camponoti-saundersi (nom. inval.)]|nr:hypothetical protein CP533_3961 [Ophiocordyceps camponoti-saundersi (nom. inval.)]